MSQSKERNNENYKHHNENEMNRPILPMSVNNLNTLLTYHLTERTFQRSQ